MLVSVRSNRLLFVLLVLVALVATVTGADAQEVPAAPTASPGPIGTGDQTAAATLPIRVGCVNLQYVAAKSKQGQLAFAELQDLTKKKESEVTARAKLLQAQQDKLQRDSALMNEPARADSQRLLQKTQLEFDRFRQDTQSEVQQFAERVERELQARLFPVVDQLSREKGLQIVFAADSPGLVWFSSAIDMSDEVIQRLDGGR